MTSQVNSHYWIFALISFVAGWLAALIFTTSVPFGRILGLLGLIWISISGLVYGKIPRQTTKPMTHLLTVLLGGTAGALIVLIYSLFLQNSGWFGLIGRLVTAVWSAALAIGWGYLLLKGFSKDRKLQGMRASG